MTALVVVVATATALTLSYRLREDLRSRLADRAKLAASISPDTDLAVLADRLTDDEITAVARRDGRAEAGRAFGRGGPRGPLGNLPPMAPGMGDTTVEATAAETADSAHDGGISTTVSLGRGTTVTLVATERKNHEVIARLVGIEILVSGVVVALVACGVNLFAKRALRPLDEMSAVAGAIAAGERDTRVHPDRADTDLGAMAASFDVMVDSLADAVSRAEHSESTMRQFLADASHELRNPTAAIGASAERLVQGAPDRDEREALAVDVVRESRRLGRLVGDLLDLSRLDAGQTDETVSDFDLVELARSEIARTERADAAPEPSVRIRITAPATSALAVRGRRHDIGRAIANVLENARRHAPAGSAIDVTIAESGGWALLAVTNDGQPIPPADRELVFERFARLDDARARRDGGTGLGLTISRAIARAGGGDLRCVEPAAGRGATFELWLPAAGPGNNGPHDT
ncbi:MAG: HAMP domain-containing sensor histidine kinase [Acidimicrobiales bacterium]